MILAIGKSTSQDHLAFQHIKECVEARGETIILFKQDFCLDRELINYEFCENSFKPSINIDGVSYDVNSFSGILWLHPMLPRELMTLAKTSLRVFIWKQFFEMRRSLWIICSDKKWLNDPFNAEKAENKVWQLSMAQKLGFKIPETLVTSSPEKIKAFFKNHNGNIINKIIVPAPIIDKVTFTHIVSEEDLLDDLSILMTPSIFQPLVEKKYELRITVVGKKIFPVKIYSQNDPLTSIDWRVHPFKKDFKVKMEACSLPKKVESKIFEYMNTLGLNYGAIDMIVTPKGEFIFLEINPAGQWYFIQSKTNLNIADAIASFFC